MTTSQRVRILAHLQNVGPLTQKSASEELGVGRLSERVRELEQDGHIIEHKMIGVSNQYGQQRVTQYTLIRHADQGEMTL